MLSPLKAIMQFQYRTSRCTGRSVRSKIFKLKVNRLHIDFPMNEREAWKAEMQSPGIRDIPLSSFQQTHSHVHIETRAYAHAHAHERATLHTHAHLQQVCQASATHNLLLVCFSREQNARTDTNTGTDRGAPSASLLALCNA